MNKKIYTTLTLIVLYLIICSFCCQPMAIVSDKILNCVGIESEIGVCSIDDNDYYNHCYIIVNNISYEPRFLGLHLRDNINYENPCRICSADEMLETKGIIEPRVIAVVIRYFFRLE